MESTSNAGSARDAALPAPRQARVGFLGTINELDPRKAVDYVSGVVLDQIFEAPYAAVAGQAAAEPRLFEQLRAEDAKGVQHSAEVRPDRFFSDGTPLTADLAARSLRRSSVLEGKATVEARGNRVWFTLASPNPRFDLTLTQGSCAIVFESGAQLAGTGPYMFEERQNLHLMQRAPKLRLVRNPRHHPAARIEELEFHVLPADSDGTPRKLVEALRDGSIDVTTELSAADLVTWKISGVVPITKPSNSTAFLHMNTTQRPLDTAAARTAIAETIDLLEIASRIYERNPAAFVATTALPPSMSRGAGAIRTVSAQGARPIAESGLKDARLTLVVPWCPRPYLIKPLAVAQIIQQRLAAAGVAIKLVETQSGEEYFNLLNAGRFDLALGGWIADTPDPADYFDALLSSQAIGNGNFANNSRWADAKTDVMLARYRAEPNDAHRRELERIIVEEVPLLPLVYGQSCVIHGRRIRNVTLGPTGSISLAAATVT